MMKYHFKIHQEKKGCWAECVELSGCQSEGKNLEELKKNCKEALNLYLDEPEDSPLAFPLPQKRLKGNKFIEIEVDPQIALSFLLRRERLQQKWTQKQTAEQLKIPLYSYQKLESSKTANPEWKTLVKLLQLFPKIDLSLAALS